MRSALYLALAAFIPEQANAQATPYKLVILWGDSGVAVVDYPSAARCQAAKTVLEERKVQERRVRQPQAAPGGGMIFRPPWQMEMVCIPA